MTEWSRRGAILAGVAAGAPASLLARELTADAFSEQLTGASGLNPEVARTATAASPHAYDDGHQ